MTFDYHAPQMDEEAEEACEMLLSSLLPFLSGGRENNTPDLMEIRRGVRLFMYHAKRGLLQ